MASILTWNSHKGVPKLDSVLRLTLYTYTLLHFPMISQLLNNDQQALKADKQINEEWKISVHKLQQNYGNNKYWKTNNELKNYCYFRYKIKLHLNTSSAIIRNLKI